ncbi:aconitate hydratase AcnA [Symbiobacterium thermophilum]|uniref:Aconitate hydratase n=1 Tax=Symbiobacterium thermophilum (strain DSM 24528 / JCM 14929 / IAM 14863 / T) TaxID=292459 RepID=Q67JK4_SYMTH|nr:aconitate hydratase AcnA [Symbiobacterium thermophilum]BAD42146.1 aconitase [Symbiobacterium thermophilum IAM 14863]
MSRTDPFKAKSTFDTGSGTAVIYRLSALEQAGLVKLDRLPFSVRILLENLLRNLDGYLVTEEDVRTLAAWNPRELPRKEIPFIPSRVVLQDFTGVPVVADLAAMRDAMVKLGGRPEQINPLVPVDLVIDHSVQVDAFAVDWAYKFNVELEFKRNRERYVFLKWAQKAFRNFRAVPPGMGIVHQVNLEYLSPCVALREIDGELVALPDTVVGTDSHTTMINGLGVLGWGVGGIEAEAAMLGQPSYMLVPEVVGFKLTGRLPEGATATDLVLTVTQMLRQKGVVEKFVEFYGPGLSSLSLADRATIANMAPEYGATMGFFPVDEITLDYLRQTGRDEKHVEMVRRYLQEQGLFRTDATPDPEFTDTLELDLSTVEPSLAGPRRPQDRVQLSGVRTTFHKNFDEQIKKGGGVAVATKTGVQHGSVVIAAITSCTNTSNPAVMIGAGLVAQKAVAKGLARKPWVKTSLAPGSRVVTDYLKASGLMEPLEALGFHVVGYGCTTCIGNSGSLPEDVAKDVTENDLVVAAVISGNRNFEGRVNPLVKANFLASPMLVVAYALAGTVDIDLRTDPVGHDPEGNPVYLKDIWPTNAEIQAAIAKAITPEMFKQEYARVFDGDENWQQLEAPEGELFQWDPDSTYIQQPPYFKDMQLTPPPVKDIEGARVLALLGDSITTDHISPAGAIAMGSPAAKYLMEHGVDPVDFNSYGSRRGNHEVMQRGTFANIRLRNALADGKEGGYTKYLPTGEIMPIWDAAVKYMEAGTPLVVIAGKDYGMGSSRDWAAKGVMLQGVKAVIAESFERIHRSNLIGMGVLPLQFQEGENAASLGLDGTEEYTITGISGELTPRQTFAVTARKADGREIRFDVTSRLDTAVEIEYYKNGGVLQTVLRRLATEK